MTDTIDRHLKPRLLPRSSPPTPPVYVPPPSFQQGGLMVWTLMEMKMDPVVQHYLYSEPLLPGGITLQQSTDNKAFVV